MRKKSVISILAAGALCAAQTGAVFGHSDDAAWLDESSSSAGSQQLTVFNPDGSSYSITPVDIQFAMLEPTSDEFTVVLMEPVVVVAMEEDISIEPLAAVDASGSTYMQSARADFSTIEENHRLNVEHG